MVRVAGCLVGERRADQVGIRLRGQHERVGVSDHGGRPMIAHTARSDDDGAWEAAPALPEADVDAAACGPNRAVRP